MSSQFQNLVVDMQQYIIEQFLSTAEILPLASVSRHYNVIATPALYARISLLLHISQVPIQRTRRIDNEEALREAQRALLATLTSRPELARYARTLEWQVQPLSKQPPFWEMLKLRDECEEEYRSHIVKRNAELHEIFNTLFPLFRNVKTVHLISSTGPDLLPIPKLFPHVKSVKLTNTSFDVVQSILHSPEQISELSIDTVSDHKAHVAILQWLACTEFPALRKLSLRCGPVSSSTDTKEQRKIFSEWKTILLSSHEMLQEVLLGFRHPIPSCNVRVLPQGVAPLLESTFVEVVGPVFTQTQWPALRLLELEGVKPFKGLWECLEAAVPCLVMSHKRRMIIERWDPVAAAKF